MKTKTKTMLVESALLVLFVAVAGCSKSSSSDGTGGAGGSASATGGHTATGGASSGGSTGTGGSSSGTGGSSSGTGGNPTVTGTGGTTGTGGATTPGGGGAGGAVVVQKVCATKTKIMNPVFMNFENYDGTVTADKYGTAFGTATPNMGTAYAGVYAFGDGSATPLLGIMGGHPPSNWAVSETVTHAATWGMGGGVWMGCADASAYKGVSFWVRGSSGSGTFSFTMNTDATLMPDATNPAGGGTCPGTMDTCKGPSKADIPLTADWTQVSLRWSDFAAGVSGTTPVVADGNNIAGFVWSVPLQFHLDPSVPADAAGPYVAIPGDLVINIDDISFIP